MAVPTATELMLPTLSALRHLGGSARNAEIRGAIAQALGLSEEDQQIPQGVNHPNVSRLEYRLKWARTYLKNAGVLSSVSTGAWGVTPKGMAASDDDVLNWFKEWQREQSKKSSDETLMPPLDDVDTPPAGMAVDGDEEWDAAVIRLVQDMDPTQVEWLFLRLLREEGFEQLEHAGKPGDGGIDGSGVYRISLLSFKVFFQCKRYQAGIGSSEIRNFRGAMEGRGERGLFMTTSWFTKSAEEEASRPGARPVDLVDGPALAKLIAKHRLGVSITQRDSYEVYPSFFRDFRF